MLTSSTRIRELGARLVTPELVIFPVRHHSPGCAWQLRRLFAERPPSVVLVEGPHSFTPLIPLLTHEQARMPLAIYTYAVFKKTDKHAEDRRAAYYPFCDYSPELVALREAAAQGIPAQFIDLDFAEQCRLESDCDDAGDRSLLDEQHYRRSAHLQALAAQLGCRDHEELWEHLFEISATTLTLEDHVTRVATYCELSRLDSRAVDLDADGTHQREAEMVHHIRHAIAHRRAGDGPVLVVVGGFHAVALPELLTTPGPAKGPSPVSVTDAASALIRYSFDRLERLNGYAAGMTAPAWQQRLWQRQTLGNAATPPSRRVRRDAALEVLADIASELRTRHGLAIPMPSLAAAYEQTLRLAHLRQRPAPARDDILDAVVSCFVKGEVDTEGSRVLATARRLFTGTVMGSVPPGAGTPPLVRDVGWRLRRQKLKIDNAERQRMTLDIYRRPVHRMTSRLLHSLVFLGVPFAHRIAGPDFINGLGLDRLQEHWEYAYSAATDAALVEASVLGVTLPLAVAHRFATRLAAFSAEGAASSARAGAAILAQACVLGLHDHLPEALAVVQAAIAADAGFDSVTAAAGTIALLCEAREPLEAHDLEGLRTLLVTTYERAMYLGRELLASKDDASRMVKALMQWRELLVSAAGERLDRILYWERVHDLQHRHDSPLIRGAASGLRYSAGYLTDAALSAGVAGHLEGQAQPHEAAGYLRGLLQTARESAWQQPELLGTLDTLLGRWDEDAFAAVLPELRLAFAEMTPRETDRIATSVAQRHGVNALGPLVFHDLTAAEVTYHLGLSRVLGEVMLRDHLADWSMP